MTKNTREWRSISNALLPSTKAERELTNRAVQEVPVREREKKGYFKGQYGADKAQKEALLHNICVAVGF